MKRGEIEPWMPLVLGYFRNPKCWKAGFSGTMAHLALMLAAKDNSKSLEGCLPIACWNASYLLSFLGVIHERITSNELEEGMARAISEQLVLRCVEDGQEMVKPKDWRVYNELARRTVYKEDYNRRKKNTSKPQADRSQITSDLHSPPHTPPQTDTVTDTEKFGSNEFEVGQVDDTEKLKAKHPLLEIVLNSYPDWPTEQAMAALADFRSSFPALTLSDWREVVDAARARYGSDVPIHKYRINIYDQAKYFERNRSAVDDTGYQQRQEYEEFARTLPPGAAHQEHMRTWEQVEKFLRDNAIRTDDEIKLLHQEHLKLKAKFKRV